MSTPDMADVARLVNADDPAPEVIERARKFAAASVITLIPPNNGDHWEIAPDLLVSGEVRDGMPVVVLDTITEEFPMPLGQALALASALLAARPLAERLADEHNTAAQDTEETSRG